MNKLQYLIYFGLIVGTAITSCRKDPAVPGNNNGTGPTLINPSDIFPAQFGIPAIPTDNPLTVEGVYLGRLLFYDPILSIDSSISCASCHFQQNAFADPAKLSLGVFGLKTGRNAPSLFNLAYSRVFFWDARQKTLREQVFEPIQAHNEMGMTLPVLQNKLKKNPLYIKWFEKAFGSSPNIFDMSLAMEQFMFSMVSKGSKFNKFFPGNFNILTEEEKRGAFLFNNFVENGGADCSHCHGGQLIQQNNPNSGGIANNGLDMVFKDKGFGAITGKPADMGTFKTPSLLNIAVTAPYMHDGRFATLEQVIDHYSDSVLFDSPTIHPIMKKHQPDGQRNLTAQQKSDLKAFLLTMTDNEYLTNPAYSNPFK